MATTSSSRFSAYFNKDSIGFFAEVELDNGARYVHFARLKTEAEIEKLVEKIQLTKDLDLDRHWTEIDPRYGSQRHFEVGDSHLYDADERHMQDFGIPFH